MPETSITSSFGTLVFNLKTMREYVSEETHASLKSTIYEGADLDPGIANEVADAMKTWATERGATHFTHWFQPLTGATAEKHDSFITPDREGGALCLFSGKDLIQGEPDASSFPSGGLRATFEARGYTAWDPTSPAFLKVGDNGATLCIPTIFCGYHGEALDKKTPLLRSMKAIEEQFCRLGKLFGIEPTERTFATLGAEQEYFLVDRDLYQCRPDLVQTGRTLFGRRPPKHQQMDDHYFGSIKRRVVSFMCDLDKEMWKLGIPAKTRHNEVSPGQFELAPMFEELNLAVDHNMVMMDTLRIIAEEHGFACLLHEKPYAGVNGSGKHNNWNVTGPDGKNWFKPGNNPHENDIFLVVICAVMKAVDQHADLLRATVATAGNDHRLGANEAPPAIISIFLGEQLSDVIRQIEEGKAEQSKEGGMIHIGLPAVPPLPRDATDRNRTSPFAFTGNRFEFRAVGSNQSCAGANVVLNTILAEALDDICTQLETAVAAGTKVEKALPSVLQAVVREHKRIVFDGDNYTEEWQQEAARRGLPNLKKTPEALKAIKSEKSIALFEKYSVLSRKELESRYEIYQDEYDMVVAIEGGCATEIARTMIVPAALACQQALAGTLNDLNLAGVCDSPETIKLLKRINTLTEKLLVCITHLKAALAAGDSNSILDAMGDTREQVDALEELLPADEWPLPSYADMMFTL